MRRDWVALALVAAGATAEVNPAGLDLVGDAVAAAAPGRLDLPYDQVVGRSIHNAYARREPIFDQLVWHGVRSLEVDVHTSRAGRPAPAGEWFVFHEDMPLARSSSCATLDTCLSALAAFHRVAPNHDPVTLFVDVKGAFSPGHTPEDLDRAIARVLGREVMVTPGDLLARCPGAATVRDALQVCRFPTTRELRGKFVVAITGGTACSPSSAVSRYDRGGGTLAFLAPNADASCPVEAYDDPSRAHVAFVNLTFDERRRAAHARARGLVARVYYGGLVGGLATEQDFFEARRSGAQHLATDLVNAEVDRFTMPAFGAIPGWDGPAVRDADPAAFAVVEATSGDLRGERDDFFFAFARGDVDAPETWSSVLSVSSSHVEPLALTCLVARASEAEDAPHASLCRPHDEGAPRLVVRARRGGKTTTRVLELPASSDVTAESHAFFRLHVEPARPLAGGVVATHVIAEASVDGETWRTVGAASVSGELPLRGVGVASRARQPVRSIVGRLTREREGLAEPVPVATLTSSFVGRGSGGRLVVARR